MNVASEVGARQEIHPLPGLDIPGNTSCHTDLLTVHVCLDGAGGTQLERARCRDLSQNFAIDADAAFALQIAVDNDARTDPCVCQVNKRLSGGTLACLQLASKAARTSSARGTEFLSQRA